jgi:hypothetical protein
MKFIISILLLLITSAYILPVKEMLYGHADICMTDMDADKEDCSKKEKAKDLFFYSNTFVVIKDSYNIAHGNISFAIPSLLHTVETPPPDIA